MINDETAKLLKREELYEGGANCPTLRYTYACACGKGRVVYCRVPGFNDTWTTLECKVCAKKYEVRTGYGHYWELIEKE